MSGRYGIPAPALAGVALLLLFSVAGGATPTTLGPAVAASVPERGPGRVTGSFSQHRIGFEGVTYALPFGAYSLDVAALTRDTGERRLIEGLKLTFNPGPAWCKPKPRFLRTAILEPDHARPTRFHLEAVELREAGRTFAVVAVDRELDRGVHRLSLVRNDGATSEEPAGAAGAGTVFEPADWSRTEIILHARLLPPDSPAHPLPAMADSGRLSWVYRPARSTLTAARAATPGSPLSPGRLEPVGAGLTLYPERPYAGDTFTASVVLFNRGERPTPRMTILWQAREEVREESLPPVAPGRDISLAFRGRADRSPQVVSVRFGDTILSRTLVPVLVPRPVLGPLAVDAGHREDPLVVRIAVGNRGTGDATAPSLMIVAADRDTRIPLPTLAPGETRIVVAVLEETTWPESFTVMVRLTDGLEAADSARIPVRRTPRPAPAITLTDFTLEGEATPGGAGRVNAVFRNNGTLRGLVRATITVRAVATGAVLERLEREEAVAIGERAVISSSLFAWTPGLTRAELEWTSAGRSGSEFLQAYAAPPPYESPEGETVLRLVTASPQIPHGSQGAPDGGTDSPEPDAFYPVPVRLTEPMRFSLPPLGQLDELSASARLVLSSAAWLTNPAGTTLLPPQAAAHREARPAVRVSVEGAGLSDAFRITAAETRFVYAVPRAALAETLIVTLTPDAASPVFLLAPPHLRIAYGAPERAAFSGAAVTETALSLVVANTARWLPDDRVTVAVAYVEPVPFADGGGRLETTVRVPRGESRPLVISLPLAPPGRHGVEVSLPLSSMSAAQRLEQLVLPSPRPVLAPVRVHAGRMRSGETGVLALIGVQKSPVTDLIVAAPDGHAAERLSIPESETAVGWFASGRSIRIDYGSLGGLHEATSASPERSGHLRLLDSGGDTPARGQFFLLRFARGGEGARPAGRVHLAVNGLLRGYRDLPGTDSGDVRVDGFLLRPPPGEAIDALLFELDDEGRVHIDRASFPVVAAPTGASRVEREWTKPVLVPAAAIATALAARAPAESTPVSAAERAAERAAEAAWQAAAWLVARAPDAFGELSPDPARALDRLGSDTSALGRMAYRRALWTLVEQWERTAQRLEFAELPSTLAVSRFRAFRASIAELRRLASDVGVLDRAAVLEELRRLAIHVDHILGRRIERDLAASLR